MDARPYQPSDRDACLALLRERAPEGEAEFAAFLETVSDHFFVLAHEGQVLACGGIRRNAPNSPEADELVWGMVHPAWERRGLGRYLLLFRSRHSKATFLDATVPAAYAPFYEKAGFRPIESNEGRIQLRKKMAVCP